MSGLTLTIAEANRRFDLMKFSGIPNKSGIIIMNTTSKLVVSRAPQDGGSPYQLHYRFLLKSKFFLTLV